MTAPEHDPACDEWAGLVYRYDPAEPEQAYPRPKPGTVVPVVGNGEVIGTVTWGETIPTETSVHPDRLWVIPEFAERGLVIPDRWEGDDS